MVYIHSTGAPAENTKERVVGHMSCDTTQRRTFETTFRVGGLNRQQTSYRTGQQEAFHRRFPFGYRLQLDRRGCEQSVVAFVHNGHQESRNLWAAPAEPTTECGVALTKLSQPFLICSSGSDQA